MASNEDGTQRASVPARLKENIKDLSFSVKERFLGLLGLRQPRQLLDCDEAEVFLQVGRTVWHAPRQLRIELWLSSLTRRHSLVSEYQTYLSQEIAREAAVDIDKDVSRTFPNTRQFHSEEGQTQLRNVLRAYAAYDPEVAYCQGMNFVTGLLLLYLPTEAHAFGALVVLMEDRKLRNFYHRSLAMLQVQLWQLSRLISPALNAHLETLGVVPVLYGASWLMTAFSADFPIPFSARIMDVLLADQCECAMLKVAVSVMKAVEPRLLEMGHLEDVLTCLRIELPTWEDDDLNALLTAAFTKPWTTRQLAVLRSTEGAETVAQAMDRVMTAMSIQTEGEEEGGEEGDMPADGRVAVTVPRLKPPPQPTTSCSSFAPSPACNTPVGGGPLGTGSMGGAGLLVAMGGAGCSPPQPGLVGASFKCHSMFSSGGGGVPAGAGAGVGSGGGSAGGGGREGNLLLSAASAGPHGGGGAGPPAVWGIPSIHADVPASPAIQAFRRAHLPCLAGGGGQPARSSRSILAGQAAVAAVAAASAGDAGGGGVTMRSRGPSADGAFASPAAQQQHPADLQQDQGSLLKATGEEWGDFSTAGATRQQWRSLSRSTPGSMNAGQRQHQPDGDERPSSAAHSGAWQGSAASAVAPSLPGPGPASGAASNASSGGASSAATSQGGASAPEHLTCSMPIPVPGSGAARAGSAVSAFAAASSAASIAPKPPLPPRQASFDRGPGGAFSRLSVVAEDPPAMQMGPAAPAPSPRGSMDMHVLGRSNSQHMEVELRYGVLLGASGGGCVHGSMGGGGGIGGGSAPSGNGDCASGTASATTGGALLSPSGISGAVSPHAGMSPRLLASAWSHNSHHSQHSHSAGGGSAGGGGGGSDTPIAGLGYMPLGASLSSATAAAAGVIELHGADSGSLLYDGEPGACAHLISHLPDDSYPAQTQQEYQQQQEAEEHVQPDLGADIAGDILRMLGRVDAGNAHAGYDPAAVLGEMMYADSFKETREMRELVKKDSDGEPIKHMPSSSALDKMAAEDMAKAQEEAERMRQELEAQLHQQRASERGGSNALTPANSSVTASTVGATASNVIGDWGAASAAGIACSSHAHRLEGGTSTVAADAADAAAAEGPLPVMATAAMTSMSGDTCTFKRPLLFVDGIPMFDPKTLMTDSNSEAQVMFTPLVSPGASSYAGGGGEHLNTITGMLNTGGGSTTPGSAAGDVSGASAGVCPIRGSGNDEEEERDEVDYDLAEPSDDDVAAEPAEAEDVGLLAPAEAEEELVAEREVQAAAEAAAGSPPAPATRGAALPAASEWVDWSQAPPIQAVAAVTVPLSEPGEEEEEEAEEGGESSDDWAEAAEEQRRGLMPRPSNAGTPGPLDSAFPEGLQPAAPQMPLPLMPAESCHEDAVAAAAARARGAAPQAYGLLPATSFVSSLAVPLPHSVSFAGSSGTAPASVAGSFTSGRPGPLFSWSQLRCDSMAASDVDSRRGSQRWTADGGDTDGDSTPRHGSVDADGVGHVMYPPGHSHAANPHQLQQQHGSGSFGRDHGVGSGSGLGAVGGSGPVVRRVVSRLSMAALALAEGIAEGDEEAVQEAEREEEAAAQTEEEARRAGEEQVAQPAEEEKVEEEEAFGSPMRLGMRAEGMEGEEVEGDAEGGVASPSSALASVEGASSGDAATTPDGAMRHAGSCGTETEGEEAGGAASDGASPFRGAALSPSLAHHIMSAYLRSEQHQQQQEQKDLEERLQQEHQDGEELSCGDAPDGADQGMCSEGTSGQLHVAAAAAAALSSGGGGFGAAPGLLLVAEELSLVSVAATGTMSGLGSPGALGSPGIMERSFPSSTRIGAGMAGAASAAASGSGGHGSCGGGSVFATCQHPKALTPFAISMEDPSLCRLSAELLQSMPPPLVLLQPDNPTPPVAIPSVGGSGLTGGPSTGGSGKAALLGGGRGGMRRTNSGDIDGGDVTLSASGIGALGGGSNSSILAGGGVSSALHSLGGSALLRTIGSHDAAPCSSNLGGSMTGGHGPCASGPSASGSAVLQALHGASFRAGTSSGGGCGNGPGAAPVPFPLPPPPAPQVPLCQTAGARLDGVATLTSATAAAPLSPLRPPLLGSSSGTVVCVSAAGSSLPVSGASFSAGSGGAAMAPPGPTAPAWTATFDFEPPLLPSRDSWGLPGGSMCTPEARLHTPDMARGVSLEAAAPASHPQ